VKHFLDNEAKGTKIIGATSMEDMVSKLKSPRRVMLLVKGKASVSVRVAGVSEWKITVSR
jgi:6-phosphogluconate dehydrogenase